MQTAGSNWQTALEKKYATRVLRPDRLGDVRQTGFVWCERPGALVLAVNRMYFGRAVKNQNVVAIVAPESALLSDTGGKGVIISPQAHELFLWIHNQAIHGTAALSPLHIHSSAQIEDSARIGDGVTVDEDVRIGHHVAINGPARIGRGTVIEAGVVIGGDGLYAKRVDKKLTHIKHFGGVLIGRDCYIHSGAVITRAVNYSESTEIGDSVHIGIQANVGHDVSIGNESVLSSHVVIAGRARVGVDVWIGASASISNMVNIGDRARVNIGSVCLHDVPPDAEVSGNFARNHQDVMRKYLTERRNARR